MNRFLTVFYPDTQETKWINLDYVLSIGPHVQSTCLTPKCTYRSEIEMTTQVLHAPETPDQLMRQVNPR